MKAIYTFFKWWCLINMLICIGMAVRYARTHNLANTFWFLALAVANHIYYNKYRQYLKSEK